jgi:hypothetical protein
MHTKLNVTHLEIFTAKNTVVLHSNIHEIEHRYFWSTWPWIKKTPEENQFGIYVYILGE